MIWYPYEQMKTMKTPYKVKKAKGVYIYTEDKKLIDSVSSWWSAIHGYSNKEINEAAIEQINNFSHVMLGGLNHNPVLELAEKLKEILPGDLNHVFFSDSGSVAVEVSLKMAIQYYNNKGLTKKKEIIALKEAYHGDTFKAMAVGDDADYHKAFPEKEGIYHISPKIKELEEILEKRHDTIAVLIVEPLLQGAAGMKMYDIQFLEEARKLCDKYDIIFIFDEVATGFGRTGNMFVSELVIPDIIVLGKALTGGYVGHAATVANKKIYEGFYSNDPSKALMHGPTFMGNALCCKIALKSIEIFLRDDYMDKIKKIERILVDSLKDLKSEKIKDIRVMGACACIEVYDAKDLQGFSQFAYNNGVWNRTFLNFMYTMPPYIIEEEELLKIVEVFKKWFTREEIDR
ncbi:adenosylmethionine--8-amino-7-oxononanoate transaminase [Crassaminicella profunda]|uniref:adenosylmethionine--8-amino-7-oxononanoate transaminase n=1 Tax=Crassaminicella profunda TaxID=1286698 RepID=UPI001CA6A3ED|nr:adenosylmethionine--8-amino-7-oxononanoate transaminase [Crassaminicella profunda]QZY53708.1 adenosylmethionine--8-amino-7-oxononanoate transaminase [Crassaminicella profunda]